MYVCICIVFIIKKKITYRKNIIIQNVGNKNKEMEKYKYT